MAVTPAQKRRMKEQAGFKCAIPTCPHTSPLDIHHILPTENGGTDTDDNLICLCKNCHGRFHNGEIPAISIRLYKQRLLNISVDLRPHEIIYLERLNQGELIELNRETRNLAMRLERLRFITINERRNGVFRLSLTAAGRRFIT